MGILAGRLGYFPCRRCGSIRPRLDGKLHQVNRARSSPFAITVQGRIVFYSLLVVLRFPAVDGSGRWLSLEFTIHVNVVNPAFFSASDFFRGISLDLGAPPPGPFRHVQDVRQL